MGVQLNGIEIYAGPPILGGPDDLDDVIRRFIDGARQSVLVAVQELDSRPIVEAIIAAARRPRQPATARGLKVGSSETWPDRSEGRDLVRSP